MLSIKNLAVDFSLHGHPVPAVHDVSFSINPGETVALVGESGSGKSVTSQAIMGILPLSASITNGEILFADPNNNDHIVDIAALDRNSKEIRDIRGGSISIIFQEPMTSLSPVHTIGDQISEALFLHRDFSFLEGMKLTQTMLAQVGFPDPKRALKMYPFELSGGLRQRAMIAMAMICHPTLLIADEPTTALDVTIQARILMLIKELQNELGMALLLITHDLGVVANMADEVVVMYHGKIMESGSLKSLFNNPQHPYLKALMHAVPRFDMEPGERLVPVREIEHQTGSIGKNKLPWIEQACHLPHLRIEGVSKTYSLHNNAWFGSGQSNLVHAVDNVSFDVQQGECFGLVGESGCGKTTLSKIIMRALTPTTGEIEYNDRGNLIDVRGLQGKDLQAFRRKMQFIFQDPFSALSPRMTIYDILREPLIVHDIGDLNSQREFTTELMRLVGLDPRFLNRYPHSFSGGERQRIGIARALALEPDLLICDEPVSALDVSIQAQVLNLLKDLQQELGLTYIFISHNLAVINYIADRIGVMCEGKLVELAPRETLFANPIHPYTRALLSAVPHLELSQPLDFESIADGAASTPALWPAPFTNDGKTPMAFLSLGDGHFVRAAASCNPSEIAA
ncbi:MAG: peptide/nickel transport system ATP-binding protein [Gammaproteobacteria bacterium]